MSDSVRPHRRQPTRLPSPWDSPGKNTGVGCHFLLQCMKVKRESEVAHVRLLATLWTAAHQAPQSMGFSRQEYWNGLPLPSPGKPWAESKILYSAENILIWDKFIVYSKNVKKNKSGILKYIRVYQKQFSLPWFSSCFGGVGLLV